MKNAATFTHRSQLKQLIYIFPVMPITLQTIAEVSHIYFPIFYTEYKIMCAYFIFLYQEETELFSSPPSLSPFLFLSP